MKLQPSKRRLTVAKRDSAPFHQTRVPVNEPFRALRVCFSAWSGLVAVTAVGMALSCMGCHHGTGSTATYQAAQPSDTTSVQTSVNVDPKVAAKKADPAELMTDVNTGDIDGVKALIANGVNVNAIGDDGATALMRAVRARNADCVAILISAHADVNAEDKNGANALAWATGGIAKTLKAAGAKVTMVAGRVSSVGAARKSVTVIPWDRDKAAFDKQDPRSFTLDNNVIASAGIKQVSQLLHKRVSLHLNARGGVDKLDLVVMFVGEQMAGMIGR